jgi:UDP-N-acetylmuramyl pentapeptide phosphotransferase/UDP-N-acetylglucosamine-1-phosphate transferase
MHPPLTALNVSLVAVTAAAMSWLLIAVYVRIMPPNPRSMHKVPVPAGAGVAIVATAVVLWPLSLGGLSWPHGLLLASFVALGALSWLDDWRPLPPAVRLGAQAVAVTVCLAALAPDARVWPALPVIAERLLAGIAWLWFINLFNFMDGIDGLAGSEALAVTLGYILLAAQIGAAEPLLRLALIIAFAVAGYLAWNWHPAKVFMGDAGSVPLGFALGWLLLDLALRGQWAAAIILPAYFAADATYTLLKRALRGEKPWQARLAKGRGQ